MVEREEGVMQREIKETEVTLQVSQEPCQQEWFAGMSERQQKRKVSSARTKTRGRAAHNAQPACGCCCATLKTLPQRKVWSMLVPHGTPDWKEAYRYEQWRYISALSWAALENDGKVDIAKAVMSWAQGANVALQNHTDQLEWVLVVKNGPHTLSRKIYSELYFELKKKRSLTLRGERD